jgi:hypothetical protein
VLSLLVRATAICVGPKHRAIESDFGRLPSSGKVIRPERLDSLLMYSRERNEVAAFKAAEAKRYSLEREDVPLA